MKIRSTAWCLGLAVLAWAGCFCRQAAATELAVATEALPDGTTGFAYAATLEATGGTAPYSWSVPVPGGYLETSAASTFAETGTAQGWKSDAGSWELALPFAFPYFGNTYTKVRVYSNGTLWFSDDDYADYLSQLYGYVSEVFLAIPVIIPQWTLMSTANGDIYVDSGADAVTIRWQGEDQGAPMNFSATLHADGQIVLSYGAGNANGGAIGLGVGDYETAPQLSAKSQSGSMENADDIVFTPMPGCYSETGAASTFAETGTAQGWQSDAGGWDLALPFAFPFFGNTHTNLRVYSNGTLWFSDFDYAGYISEGYLSEAFKYYPVIAALWSQAGTANGDIYVESGADAVTIRWQGEEGDAAVNFAATLHADGKIVLSYGAGNANGGGIAIGAGDGTTAAQISAKSQSGSMENANDIVFTPNNDLLPMPGWLQLSADGALQGAPEEAGDYSFTVIVTDAAGAVAQTNLTLAVAASTAGEAAVDGTTWSYIANGTEAMVTGASAAEGHVTVPSELGGCPVTTIGPEAFSENTTMTGLTIPDSVTTLCAGAFQYCSALETVSLGNGLRVIGDSFYGCQALTEVVFGTGLETITDGAFRSSGVTQLVFPDSLRVVTSNAFRGCSGLTNIVWGAGIESIGNYAFYSCRALGSVTIPDSVTNIGSAAFAYCSALTNAVIGDGVAEIGASAFEECSKLAEVTFGSHVARIGQSAFYYCVKLAAVALPDGLKDIAPSAFAITPLTSVTIPDSVTNIGRSAFARCQLMTTATLGKHVESLGSNAFYDCPLETITIPASLQGSLSAASVRSECMVIVLDDEREEEVVDGRTWYYVTENGAAMVKGADPAEGALTVPATLGGCPVTAIGGWAFAGCDGLTGVTIPDCVTNLGAGAFQNCTALEAVALGNGLGEVGENAFYGCTALTEIAFGTGIETIGSGAFQNSGLVQVALPNGLRVVATNAFRGCASLTNIVWGAGIESIEAYAFAECTALTEVVVPGSVASIGYCAFYRCLGLATATVGMNVESIGYSVFSGCPLTTLYAPFALEGQLVNAGIPWSCTVVEWAVADGRTWQYIVGDGVATVTGVEPAEGALAVPATLGGRSVTGIGAGAFAGTGVTEAVLPDGVASIGEGAFDAPNFTRLEVGGALQDAVWAVPEGPEVRIEARAGTYGPIETSNKVVRIVGLEGAATTVIDASGTGGRCAMLADTNTAYSTRVSQHYNSVGCQTNSVLEGFTLTGAAVAGDGGGVFGGTLENCVVVSNQASYGYGGGLAYGNAFGCRFEGNEASSSGGALYCSALAEDCVFVGNRASCEGGAAAHVACLRGCEIRDNEAQWGGGGAAYGGTVENCQVVGNHAGRGGGGLYNFETVRDSRILENEAGGSGGGISGNYDWSLVSNCTVASNRVQTSGREHGGGVFDVARLVGCEVSDNVVEGQGGAWGGGVYMYDVGSVVDCVVRGNAARAGENAYAVGGGGVGGTWMNCTIADNVAEGGTVQGGGLYRVMSTSCEISGNRAAATGADGEAVGGGTYLGSATGCVVSNNEAQWGGGTYSGSATGCTIVGNRADTGGGACYGTLVNCIVTKNHAATGGGWYPGSGSHNTFTLNETETENSYSPAWGAANTLVWGEKVAGVVQMPSGGPTECPMADPENGDYRLLAGSEAIDAGSPTTLETDFAGNPRTQGAAPDLGALEAERGGVGAITMTFVPGEGLVKLSGFLESYIKPGRDATPPEVGAVSGWKFEGWTPSLQQVMEETTFHGVASAVPSDWSATIHRGDVTADETWAAGTVHVVEGTVWVTDGATLTIEAGAVVKFAPGAKLLQEGGMAESLGATFTHLYDDEVGGDTLGDGAARVPVSGDYEVQLLVAGEGTEYRYAEPTQETTPDGNEGIDVTVWRAGTVHVLAEGYTVASGKTLRLEAGTIVKVGDGQTLAVEGRLVAAGTAAKPVVITSMYDDEHGGDTDGDGGMRIASGGDWDRIDVSGTAAFDHCRVLYGSGTANYGGIEAHGGTVTFDNGEIAHMMYECVNAHSGGEFTARNSAFWDASLGFGYYGGLKVKANNCVFHGLTTAIRQNGKQLVNCVFSECLAFTDQSGDGSHFDHCVFWNPEGYGAQEYVKVGEDGNLWGDPKFADAEGGDFHVGEGSACIDAGDGGAAPETDMFGNPRVTLKAEAATGAAGKNGAVPDIGVHEYNGRYSGGDDVDVVPTEMRVLGGAAGAMATGAEVTLVWRLSSEGAGAYAGTWTDRVRLTDGKGREVVLGEQKSSGRIEPGTSKLYWGTFTIPLLMDGEWALGVEANVDRGVLEGANTGNNGFVSTNTVAVSNPAVAADGGTFEARRGETLVRVEGIPVEGGLLGLEANGMENMTVLGTSGNVPSESRTWPVLNGSGEVWMPMASVPATNAVYLLVNNPGAPETVTLSIGALETRVTGVSPATLPCSTPAALTLEGTGLRGVTAVELWKGDAQVAASTDVAALSDTKATATFALAEVAPGTYSAKMRVGDEVHDVPGAVELAAVQIGPQLEAWLELPKSVRDGRVFKGYVCYQNTGDADMAAPLFAVSGQEPTTKVSASPSSKMQENKAYVVGASPSVPKNILKAGESGHMPFYFTMQGTYHLELRHVSETGAADAAAFVNQWWELEQKAALAMQEDAEAEVLRQAALENLAQELAAAAASAPAEPATATLSGTFVEETTGLPITNGTLHAMSGTGIILGEWKTDETGAFAYTVVTPGMVATLQSDEYELLGGGAGPYVFEGEQSIVVTGRLRGVVSGQVVEAGTTNGVVNLPVRLVPEAEGAWERKICTDENGCFEMRGLDDGAYTLTTAAGFAWQPAAGQRIELSATNRAATMVLEVAPGLTWMGTLLQEGTSNGVAGVHLRLCDTNKATLAEATTDEDGDFVFAGLAAGDYVVRADGARWAIVPEDANVRLEGEDPLHEGDLHAGHGRLFRAMPDIGLAPLEVAFTVLLTEETENASAFAWDLDGDGEVDSTDVLPTWTYEEAGTYDVALMVTLEDGSVVTNAQPACVTVRPAIPTVYQDGIVVLTEGAPENTGDYQVAGWTNGILTLTRLTAEPERGIEAGTKIFFDPGGDLPYALLQVASIVSETDADMVLSTETVPFGEIFRSFSMKLATSAEPGPGPSGRRGGRHAKTIRDIRKSGEFPGDLGGGTNTMGTYLPIEGTKHFDFDWSMQKETQRFMLGIDVDLHNTLVFDGNAWLLLGGMGYEFNLEDHLTYKVKFDATGTLVDEHLIFATQDVGDGWFIQVDGSVLAKVSGAAGVEGEETWTLSRSDQLRFDENGVVREGTQNYGGNRSLLIYANANAEAALTLGFMLGNKKLGNTWIKLDGFVKAGANWGFAYDGKEGSFSKNAWYKAGVTMTKSFDLGETVQHIADETGLSDGPITLENVMQKLHMPALSLSALQETATKLASEKMAAALNVSPALGKFLEALVQGKDLQDAVGSLADGWKQLIVKELAKELGIPEEFQNYSFADFMKKIDEYRNKLPKEMGQLMGDLNGLAEAGVLDSSGAQREALKEYLSRGTMQADFPVLRQIVNTDAAEEMIWQILRRLSEARNQVLAARDDILKQLGEGAKERLEAIAPALAENWNQVDEIRNALSGDLQQSVNQIRGQLDGYKTQLYTYVDEQRNNLEAEVPFSESDVAYVQNALDLTRSELDTITQNINSLQEDITSVIRELRDLTTLPKTRALRPLPAHRRAVRRGGDPTLEALHGQIVALDSGISQISSQIQALKDQFDETAGSIRTKLKQVSGFLEKAKSAIGSKSITKREEEIRKLLEKIIAEKVAEKTGIASDSVEDACAMIKTAAEFKTQLLEQSKKVKQYKDEYRAALKALQQALNGGQAEAIDRAKKELQNVQNEMNGSIESLGTTVGNKFKGFQVDVGNALSVFMTAEEILPALMDTAKGIRISSAKSLENAGKALFVTVKPVYEKVNLGAEASAIVETLDMADQTWKDLRALYGKALEFRRNRKIDIHRRSARDLSGGNAFDWASTGADGMSTCAKLLLGLELDAIDSDGDGMMDVWEDQWTLSPLDKTGADGAQGDPDDDGLANIEEYRGRSPKAGVKTSGKRRDGDSGDDGGAVSGWPSAQATYPTHPDTDDGGVIDSDELLYGLDPFEPEDDEGLCKTCAVEGEEFHGCTCLEKFGTSFPVRLVNGSYHCECGGCPDCQPVDDEGEGQPVQSCDPNEISGPAGVGEERLVARGQELEYTIYFENKAEAEASAQEIRVEMQLDPGVDWSTFRAGSVQVGATWDEGLEGKANWTSEVAMAEGAYRVRSRVSCDPATGMVEWYLRVVDPEGSFNEWPDDPYAGMLPPNDPETHCGEGALTYKVNVREDAAVGSVVASSATITFDYNEPIATDPSWWNTVSLPWYPVTFVDEDGSVLKEAAMYMEGTAAVDIVQPETPEKAADERWTYEFAGWEPELAEVTTNATYTATYRAEVRKYDVTFAWHGGSATEAYGYGETPVAPEVGGYAEDGVVYTFAGWDADVAAVTGNVTYTATYDEAAAVAQIVGGEVYPSLAAAVGAAAGGDTVVLLADDGVSFAAGGVVIDKDIVIDGAGFTVRGVSNANIHNVTANATPPDVEFDGVDGSNVRGFFVKAGNVTFTNLALTEFGDTDYVNKFGYTPIQTAAAYDGTLTIADVDIDKFNRTAICIRGGTFAISGGSIEANAENRDVLSQGKDHFQQPIEIRGGTGTIDGVTVLGGDTYGSNGGGAIVAWSDVTVHDVSIDFTGVGIWADYANIEVTGENTSVAATDKALFVEDGGSIAVAAGDFAGELAVDAVAGSAIVVSGGTFDAPVPAAFAGPDLASTTLADGNDKYTVRTARTVTFDSNGGTPVAAATVADGEPVAAPDPAPEKANAVLRAWMLAGTDYDFASPVTSDLTLVADWTPTHQPVTFDANGGECGVGTVTRELGGTYGPLPVPTRDGYAYTGWYTARDGGKRVYASDVVREGSPQVLYAHWSGGQAVTFDANGGECEAGTVTREVGGTYGTLPVPTREGHAYAGWYTAPDGGKRVYASSIVTAKANVTLYAHWTTEQIVTFDANGGECGVATMPCEVGGTYGTLPVPTREGFAYAGWFTAPTGGIRVYAASEVTGKATRTLYAHWTGDQTVTFDANGGECSVSTRTVAMGGTYGAMPVPTRAGFTYAGWFTAREGGSRVYAATEVSGKATKTLYAHWKEAAQTTGVSISGFGMRSQKRGVRSAGESATASDTVVLRFDAAAGTEYEVQWNGTLCGEWETVLRWTATVDGEAELKVPLFAGENGTGFYRVTIPQP